MLPSIWISEVLSTEFIKRYLPTMLHMFLWGYWIFSKKLFQWYFHGRKQLPKSWIILCSEKKQSLIMDAWLTKLLKARKILERKLWVARKWQNLRFKIKDILFKFLQLPETIFFIEKSVSVFRTLFFTNI